MWIVRLALSRPYTFIVMALVIALLAAVVIPRTPTDIFPEINIPVIAQVWTYTGLEPQEMERRITTNVERGRHQPGAFSAAICLTFIRLPNALFWVRKPCKYKANPLASLRQV